MPNFFQSVTKIVLLIITFSLSVALFLGKIDTKDYMMIAIMVFTFYYSKPVEVPTNGDTH